MNENQSANMQNGVSHGMGQMPVSNPNVPYQQGVNVPNGYQSAPPNMVGVNPSNYNTVNMGYPGNSGYIPNQQKDSKQKKIVILLAVIIFISLVICVGGIAALLLDKKKTDGENVESMNRTGTRTMMIYVVGSNLESGGGSATRDLQEMIDSHVDTNDTKVVVYLGGTKKWLSGNYQNNAIYELQDGQFHLVQQDSARSMADPSTLTYFLSYAKEHYDTDLYDLILWDHGGGPVLGYGQDEAFDNDILSLNDLQTALADSPFKNEKLEILGFDACLMASVEIASELKDYASYLVASQAPEPSHGWNYDFLSNINQSTDSISLGKSIVDSYYDFYNERPIYSNWVITVSMIDLTKIKDVNASLDNLFGTVETALTQGYYSDFVKSVSGVRTFGESIYNLVDLYDMGEKLSSSYPEQAAALKEQLNSAILYNRSNVPGSYGLSIFYPYSKTSELPQIMLLYNKIPFSTKYQSFVNTYVRTLTGTKMTDWDLTREVPVVDNSDGTLSIELDENVQKDYARSMYIIFKDMKDGYYMPVYRSFDTTLKGNQLIANFNRKQLMVTDSNNEKGTATLIEYLRTDDYVLYEMYGFVTSYDDFEMKSVTILYRVDEEHPDGYIVRIVEREDEDDQLVERADIQLEDWDILDFFNSKYKILDESGNYTSNWESAGEVYLTRVGTDEDFTIQFEDLDENEDYYAVFVVEDTQGNTYSSNLVKIE